MNYEEINELIFTEEELKILVIDKLIHPIGKFLKDSVDFKQLSLLNEDEIDNLIKFTKKDTIDSPRIIFLGCNQKTGMLHLLMLNDKYGELKSEKIIRSLIGLVSNYLDPTNPLEVKREPTKIDEKEKGLTQLSIKTKKEVRKKIPGITFSYYAPLDARSYETIYFDIPMKLEKTFYVPICKDKTDKKITLNEGSFIGVLIISFDYNKETSSENSLNAGIKKFKSSPEYKNYLTKYKEFIEEEKYRFEELESQEWFNKLKNKIHDVKLKIGNNIEVKSARHKKKLNILYPKLDSAIKDGKSIPKKLLLNRLFIYEDFINLFDFCVLDKMEVLLKLKSENE